MNNSVYGWAGRYCIQYVAIVREGVPYGQEGRSVGGYGH